MKTPSRISVFPLALAALILPAYAKQTAAPPTSENNGTVENPAEIPDTPSRPPAGFA